MALFSLPAEDTVRPGYAWPRVSQGTPGGCVAAVAPDEAEEEATLTLLRFLALPLEVVGFLD